MGGFRPYHRVIGGIANKPEPSTHALRALPQVSSDVTVGVIDTGIVLDDQGNPPAWFGTGHLVGPLDRDVPARSDGQGDVSDGHGTFVAGLILNEAPTARVRMCGVLNDESADVMTDQDDAQVAEALAALAADKDVEVVNLSFGGGAWAESQEPPRLKKALGEFVAARPHVAIVAAAGNEHGSSMVWPAAFDGVLAVGASDRSAAWRHHRPSRARFSNYGPWVDVFAEGVDLLGPLPRDGKFDGWSRWSGTSFSAAVVSGRLAQIVLERGCTGTAAVAELLAGTVTVADLNAAGTTGRWAPRTDPAPIPRPGG